MINNNLFRDLLRYGKIKVDFEAIGRCFRACVFEYHGTKYFVIMVDGEVLKCEEV